MRAPGTAEDGEGEPAVGRSSPQAVVAAGLRAGKPLREVAVDLYGAARVDAEWIRDGWMRVRVRRLALHARDAALGDGTGPRPSGRR